MPAENDATEAGRASGKVLDLPWRSAKPRRSGLTAITDNGIPAGELALILESYHLFIDLAKIGVGSAYLEPRLGQKLRLYGDFGIPVYFGGTLFEKYHAQGRLDAYLRWLESLKVSWLEASNGITAVATEEMAGLIGKVARHFNVLAEVGKKKAREGLSPGEWVAAGRAYLQAGCRYVVLEGRHTADVGIYDAGGTLLTGLVKRITADIDPVRIIFEAPTAHSQNQLINLMGTNVNLGNVFVRDLLLLESQRRGLREETFFIGG